MPGEVSHLFPGVGVSVGVGVGADEFVCGAWVWVWVWVYTSTYADTLVGTYMRMRTRARARSHTKTHTHTHTHTVIDLCTQATGGKWRKEASRFRVLSGVHRSLPICGMRMCACMRAWVCGCAGV